MVQMQSAGATDMDMDATWKYFLRDKVNSFIKWDLVRFFHDNPHTVDTAENIARYVGRDVPTCQHELNGLAQVGVLEAQRAKGVTIYRLSSRDDIRQLVDDFVSACHDRDFRVKAINYVIRAMDVAS